MAAATFSSHKSSQQDAQSTATATYSTAAVAAVILHTYAVHSGALRGHSEPQSPEKI